MKKFNKWGVRGGIVTLVAACLLGGVVLAASTAGDKTDPLVSYSYFTNTILVDLLDVAEARAESTADDLKDQFDDQIEAYSDEMESLVADAVAQNGGATSTGSASYSVVTLTAGQTVSLKAGDEVMLRIGTATVSGGTPALIDTTGGTELANGGGLTANHLYLCTIDGRTLTAGNSTTWILLKQS